MLKLMDEKIFTISRSSKPMSEGYPGNYGIGKVGIPMRPRKKYVFQVTVREILK